MKNEIIPCWCGAFYDGEVCTNCGLGTEDGRQDV